MVPYSCRCIRRNRSWTGLLMWLLMLVEQMQLYWRPKLSARAGTTNVEFACCSLPIDDDNSAESNSYSSARRVDLCQYIFDSTPGELLHPQVKVTVEFSCRANHAGCWTGVEDQSASLARSTQVKSCVAVRVLNKSAQSTLMK